MSIVRLIAAATAGALGAPSVVSLSGTTSFGFNGNTAGVALNNNGSISIYFNDVPIVQGYWLSPVVNVSEYEVRATLSSGDTPTGTFGSWNALSTSQDWTITEPTIDGNLTAEVLLEIRWTGNNVVQDSATYSLNSTGPIS